MKVSVIITTTGRQTIYRAIESVKSQSFKDYELIVIEDRELRGGAWALNQGIDKAQGEYIAILDDDDDWNDDTKLEKQVKFLDENPDYIACGCGPQKGQGKEIKVNLIGTPFAHVSMMFRKGLRYNESLRRAKDLDFMIRLSQYGKLGIVDGITVHFGDSTLEKKIDDCHWHRKVCLLHKEFTNWWIIYIRLWLREIKLRYYKFKNMLLKITGKSAK
jgi:glycosyltransferase involved in cell wall biosynthesis